VEWTVDVPPVLRDSLASLGYISLSVAALGGWLLLWPARMRPSTRRILLLLSSGLLAIAFAAFWLVTVPKNVHRPNLIDHIVAQIPFIWAAWAMCVVILGGRRERQMAAASSESKNAADHWRIKLLVSFLFIGTAAAFAEKAKERIASYGVMEYMLDFWFIALILWGILMIIVGGDPQRSAPRASSEPIQADKAPLQRAPVGRWQMAARASERSQQAIDQVLND